MLQLTTQLSQDGIMDSNTKKYIKNIDLGIKQLVTKLKK